MEAGIDLDLRALREVMAGSFTEKATEKGTPLFEVKLGGRTAGGLDRELVLQAAGADFSRDDAASMRVVDEMVANGWDVELLCSHTSPEPILTPEVVWTARFTARRIYGRLNGTKVFRAHPDRRVAIALAAIRAVAALGRRFGRA